MCSSKRSRSAAVLVTGLLLAAAPAIAAPAPDHAPAEPAGPGQVAAPAQGQLKGLLADWWVHLTAPLVNLLGAHGAGVDPDAGPATEATTDDPTTDLEHGPGVDPNG